MEGSHFLCFLLISVDVYWVVNLKFKFKIRFHRIPSKTTVLMNFVCELDWLINCLVNCVKQITLSKVVGNYSTHLEIITWKFFLKKWKWKKKKKKAVKTEFSSSLSVCNVIPASSYPWRRNYIIDTFGLSFQISLEFMLPVCRSIKLLHCRSWDFSASHNSILMEPVFHSKSHYAYINLICTAFCSSAQP